MFVVSVAAAFAAGRYIGVYDAEKRFSALGLDIANEGSVRALSTAHAAIDRLQEPNIQAANQILVRYAKLQVPGVVACSKSPTCRVFAGPRLQSAAELQDVQALDERLVGPH